MNKLPPTVFQQVALNLEPKDLISLGLSSKSQYKQMTDQELWKRYKKKTLAAIHSFTNFL
jgi:hypothetical protein